METAFYIWFRFFTIFFLHFSLSLSLFVSHFPFSSFLFILWIVVRFMCFWCYRTSNRFVQIRTAFLLINYKCIVLVFIWNVSVCDSMCVCARVFIETVLYSECILLHFLTSNKQIARFTLDWTIWLMPFD